MPLKDWLNTPEIVRLKAMSNNKLTHEMFWRNPLRTMWCNRELFGSPADGTITTQGRFDADADMIDVKGLQIAPNDLLGPHKIDGPAMVIAIFMSYLDCHWNRCPTECQIQRFPLPPLRTGNVPMLSTEEGLLDDGLIKPGTMAHMKFNGRVVNKCFAGHMRYTYYIVQIADSDVSKIVPIDPEVVSYPQNDRFGQIIYGSMNVLILPLDKRFRFRPLCKIGDHVESANDAIVKVERAG